MVIIPWSSWASYATSPARGTGGANTKREKNLGVGLLGVKGPGLEAAFLELRVHRMARLEGSPSVPGIKR